MLDGTPPDSYWEPPDVSRDDLWDAANKDADMLVSEWAAMGEYEVFISVNGWTEPVLELTRVQQDGEVLYAAPDRGIGLEFDTIEELRDHLEEHFPFPADA